MKENNVVGRMGTKGWTTTGQEQLETHEGNRGWGREQEGRDWKCLTEDDGRGKPGRRKRKRMWRKPDIECDEEIV